MNIIWKIWSPTLMLVLVVAGYSPAQQAPPLKMGQHDEKTFVGLISDTNCGARHKLKDKSAEECTRFCVRQGAGFALVAGPKVYVLKGDTNDLGVLAGQKVKVTGTLEGNTITAQSVAPTQ